jgi:hypothetical protein
VEAGLVWAGGCTGKGWRPGLARSWAALGWLGGWDGLCLTGDWALLGWDGGFSALCWTVGFAGMGWSLSWAGGRAVLEALPGCPRAWAVLVWAGCWPAGVRAGSWTGV